jgi:hypothetical protein
MTDAPRVNVITSCTGRKVMATRGETVPAERLYSGQQHLRLMRGVDRLRGSGAGVDVWIVSAGHGLVRGHSMLPPYDKTFQGQRASERRRMSDDLGIPSAIRDVLALSADLTVVLLGDTYLEACRLDGDLTLGSPTLVFASASTSLAVRAAAGLRVVPLRVAHTRRFNAGFVALKGEIGGRLLGGLAQGMSVNDLLSGDPLRKLDALEWSSEPALATATLF